jgi:hypothetical protein
LEVPVPTLRHERRITADPTSTALLLAGPTAIDLWPASRRVGEADGRILVEAQVPAGTAEVRLQAWPPRRTPVAFVVRFGFRPSSGHDLPAVEGTLTLRYDTAQSTRAELALELSGSDELLAFVSERAEEFLANLAAAAESRATAA